MFDEGAIWLNPYDVLHRPRRLRDRETNSLSIDFKLSSSGWFCGVVVITSALHADGREFEPRQNLLKRYFSRQLIDYIAFLSAWHQRLLVCSFRLIKSRNGLRL